MSIFQSFDFQIKPTAEIMSIPYSFSLTANVRVPLTITSSELMERCRRRIDKPSEFVEIFDELVPPPCLPEAPKMEKLSPEKVHFCLLKLDGILNLMSGLNFFICGW